MEEEWILEEPIKLDIKILEELKNRKVVIKTDDNKTQEISLIEPKYIIALRNVLSRLEQDERVIEEMAEYIHITQHCKVLFGGKKPIPYLKEEIIDHFRKKCE